MTSTPSLIRFLAHVEESAKCVPQKKDSVLYFNGKIIFFLLLTLVVYVTYPSAHPQMASTIPKGVDPLSKQLYNTDYTYTSDTASLGFI